jgi:2OG-Fe(II) oxygenase superfamily
MTSGWDFSGYFVVDRHLDDDRCAALLGRIETYVAGHDLPLVHRPHARRQLHYRVIDGLRVAQDLAVLDPICAEVKALVEARLGVRLQLLADRRVAVNVNVTPPGGSYRWHYDRNPLTALLYLNAVEGGALEVCPDYRLSHGRHSGAVGRAADRVLQTWPARRAFGRTVSLTPRPGDLVVMRGDRCLHSVSPVTGDRDRVNVVISFDDGEHPRVRAQDGDELDTYLYSQDQVRSADPNYRRAGPAT